MHNSSCGTTQAKVAIDVNFKTWITFLKRDVTRLEIQRGLFWFSFNIIRNHFNKFNFATEQCSDLYEKLQSMNSIRFLPAANLDK